MNDHDHGDGDETRGLEDLGDGRTKLVTVSLFHTSAECDGMIEYLATLQNFEVRLHVRSGA